MHPPLTLHRYPMCAEIIEDFQKCHVDHPIGKFFGKCTELKIKLDRCFRQESDCSNEKKMKVSWQLGNGRHLMPVARTRSTTRLPKWIIILLCLVFVYLISAYVHPPRWYSKDWMPPVAREFTDDELVSCIIFRNILSMPLNQPKNPKIAFMFLTPGSLPLQRLWEKFFQVASGGIGSSIENYVGGDSNVAAQSKLKNVNDGDNSTLNVSCFIGLLMELLQKVELLPQIQKQKRITFHLVHLVGKFGLIEFL